MKKKLLIVLAIIFVLVMALALFDFLKYNNGKSYAQQQTHQMNLSLGNYLSLNRSESSSCYGRKVVFSVSYGCSAKATTEYRVTPYSNTNLLELFNSLEEVGWKANGNIKNAIIYEPESLSKPACAQLYNDQRYPTEQVTLRVCRKDHESSVSLDIISKYRPSVVMMIYLGIKAQNQVQ